MLLHLDLQLILQPIVVSAKLNHQTCCSWVAKVSVVFVWVVACHSLPNMSHGHYVQLQLCRSLCIDGRNLILEENVEDLSSLTSYGRLTLSNDLSKRAASSMRPRCCSSTLVDLRAEVTQPSRTNIRRYAAWLPNGGSSETMAIYGYNYYNQVIDGRTPRKLTVPNQPDHWISVGLPPGNSSNTDAETACSPQKNEPHTLKMYGVSKKEPDLMVFLESNPSVGCKNPHVCCLRCPNFPHLAWTIGQIIWICLKKWIYPQNIPKISPKWPCWLKKKSLAPPLMICFAPIATPPPWKLLLLHWWRPSELVPDMERERLGKIS